MKPLLLALTACGLVMAQPSFASESFEAVGQVHSVNIATGSVVVDHQRYRLPLHTADSITQKSSAITLLRLGTTVSIVGTGQTIAEIAILHQPSPEEEQQLKEELGYDKAQ